MHTQLDALKAARDELALERAARDELAPERAKLKEAVVSLERDVRARAQRERSKVSRV